MRLKIRYTKGNCELEIHGDRIDVKSAENVTFRQPHVTEAGNVSFDSKLIDLGFALKLPDYYEAELTPRSSLYKKKGLILANSVGIIDSGYCGNGDIWKFNALALKKSTIKVGDRIGQFRIQPSQFAPWWVKLKWLFFNKIEFEEVIDLETQNRGGFGKSGGYDESI